jgi:hypothetical protein
MIVMCLKPCYLQPSPTVAITHTNGLWLWCQQDKQQQHLMHRTGIFDPSKKNPPWPSSCKIHLVIQPHHICHDKLMAAHANERSYLAAKAKLTACAQLGCDPDRLLFDYHSISSYQLHWYAINMSHLTRAQQQCAQQHRRIRVIEPSSDAIARAIKQLTRTAGTPVMIIQTHQQQWYISTVQHQPNQCTMQHAMTFTQFKRYVHEQKSQLSWLWIDMQTLITGHDPAPKLQPHTTSQNLMALLADHLPLKLPSIASQCSQPCMEAWQDLPMDALLSVYGAMLRRCPYGH